MKKLLSLKKFQKENQDALLEKEILAKVNGGMGGGSGSVETESRSTLDEWNCDDRQIRIRRDGGIWSEWVSQRYSEINKPYSS